jgi:hypothetical protein
MYIILFIFNFKTYLYIFLISCLYCTLSSQIIDDYMYSRAFFYFVFCLPSVLTVCRLLLLITSCITRMHVRTTVLSTVVKYCNNDDSTTLVVKLFGDVGFWDGTTLNQLRVETTIRVLY